MQQLAYADPGRFRGRRIVKTVWNDEEVEAVEGLLAYHRHEPIEIEMPAAAAALNVRSVNSMGLGALGIGVIATDEELELEVVSSVGPVMAPDLEWVEPVFVDRPSIVPNDPFYAQQWGLREIVCEEGWELVEDHAQILIAVLDSGIPIQGAQLSHPDLSDSRRFQLGPDVVNFDAIPADDNGHGTHVTGIAAATSDNGVGVAGVTWRSAVRAIKVFDQSQGGTSVTFKDGVVAAVQAAQSQGRHLVINYSGGGPRSNTKRTAVEYALANGALVVAAAGNREGGPVDFPAAYARHDDAVIAVGAVDRDRNRSSFASRGPELSVVAPGTDIFSTMPNYEVYWTVRGLQTKYDIMSGTSMAAPFVSGLAALVWSKWPGLTAAQVKDRIVGTADHIAGDPQDFGAGIINVERALG